MKEGRQKILRKATVAIAVVLVAWSLWLWLRPLNPDDRAAVFATLLSRRDWGAIYDMASEREKSMQEWGRKEFITVMDELSSNWPATIGPISIHGDWAHQTTWKMFTFRFDAKVTSSDTDPTKTQQWFDTPFYLDEEGWHPRIFDLPLHVLNMGKRPEAARIRTMIEACRKAGIKGLARMDDRREYSIDRLELYSQGKLPAERVFHFAERLLDK